MKCYMQFFSLFSDDPNSQFCLKLFDFTIILSIVPCIHLLTNKPVRADSSKLSFAQGNVLVSTHLLLKAIFCAGQCSSFHTLTAQCTQQVQPIYNISRIHS
ncbi:uncharacterized protein LOC131078052 isoform X2 [Cryptomeria japonica]|uniref:uncharacterized protein LOC131078052 isoform X2 n=1 Tax=Cryptomeria japonica TaxID=3369 RepID=UPI0027DA8557|nr:uncharacterized protein LOC131078052 isoform X2 [Cryptomeria japonica]XP_059065811.1 uncharacterized protein LOC131078052 isoform X2 [Cryptomeria japonica]